MYFLLARCACVGSDGAPKPATSVGGSVSKCVQVRSVGGSAGDQKMS